MKVPGSGTADSEDPTLTVGVLFSTVGRRVPRSINVYRAVPPNPVSP